MSWDKGGHSSILIPPYFARLQAPPGPPTVQNAHTPTQAMSNDIEIESGQKLELARIELAMKELAVKESMAKIELAKIEIEAKIELAKIEAAKISDTSGESA